MLISEDGKGKDSDNRGISFYSRETEVVTTGDGERYTLEAIVTANPGLTAPRLREMLKLVPPPPETSPEVLRMRILRTARRAGMIRDRENFDLLDQDVKQLSELAKDAATVSGNTPRTEGGMLVFRNEEQLKTFLESSDLLPPKPTAESSLLLILEEIRSSPDTLASVGQWLTRFTREATALIDGDE